MLEIVAGSWKQKVEFQFFDIPSSFNLLLRRSWIHDLDGVASSLHQKMEFINGKKVIELYGDSWIRMMENAERASVLEVQQPEIG